MNAKQVREIYIFAVVLVVQSLPFLSAVALACIEGTRFNSLAYWRGIEAKAVDLLPQPAALAAVAQAAGRQPGGSGAVGRAIKPGRACYPASAVSASRTQYDVPTGIVSSLKL